MTINVALAGAGAFGIKHLDAIKAIDGVKVISLMSRELAQDEGGGAQVRHPARHHRPRRQPADQGGRRRHPVHADASCTRRRRSPAWRPASTCRSRSRSATRWPTGRRWSRPQQATGLVAMCGHTRRFNPSHQWVRQRILAGEFNIQQMDVQTYFFRRTNMNALGQPRSWTDHLLWHHAAHTVDLFAYQARQPDREGQRDPGPDPPDARHRDGHEHPARRRENGAICTLSPVVQQRRAARHLLPLHRRHRHLHRALRRPRQRQGGEDRRLARSTCR